MFTQATAKSSYKDGQWCMGVYCGQHFTGRIGKHTRPTPDYRNLIFSIDLDYTIIVYGQERNSIEIWTNDSDTLYLEKKA